MKKIRQFINRMRNLMLILVLATAQTAASVGPFMNLQKAAAAFQCVNDTAGANDEPGQKDLTKMCVDYAGVPGGTVATIWNWDDLGTSGSNTLDACNLFDTDNDGKINYSVCVTTQGNPASIQALTTYSCGDDKVDRCTSPNAVVSSGTTSCGVSSQSTDPFPAGDVYPTDIQGACTIQLLTVGGANSKLVDVCSYPSQQPNSSPSDCVIFTANPVALVELVKNLNPTNNPGRFDLTIDGPGATDTSTVANQGHGGTTGIVGLNPGNGQGSTATVSEAAYTGTSLANYNSTISCVKRGTAIVVTATGNAPSWQIPIKDGDNIVCTITNTAAGSITIVKDTVPNDGTDFTFTTNTLPGGNFVLDDDSDPSISNNKVFNNLSGGTFSVAETANSAYVTTSSCSDGSPVNAIVLSAGENITCTFVNTKRGHLIVQKTTVPAADPTQFSINATGNGTITGGGAGVITDATDKDYEVTPGTYSVTETVPAGWTKTGDTCQNVVVAAGQTVTCLITNTKNATLNIIKDALPNHEQNFGFTTTNLGGVSFNLDDDADGTLPNTQTINTLLPGSYSVTESATPGWSLTGLTCNTNNFNAVGSTVTVNMAAGQTTNCTFTNTKLVSISGIKYTSSATGVLGPVLAGWTIFIDTNGNGTVDQGELTAVTDAGGNYSFTNLLPGSFALAEVLQAGWTQIFGPAPFSLAAGETATNKNFGNFQNGSISGFKWNDVNGNGTYDNEAKLNGWTMTLFNAQNQQVGQPKVTDVNGNYSFSNLAPGTYSVCETPQNGWVQTFPANNACHTIIIDQSGETNSNTNFGNQGRGTITVIKNVDTDGNGTIDVYGATNWTWDITGGAQNTATGSSQNVAAGTYTVNEDQKVNFHVVSVICDTQVNAVSESAQVVVAPGANVTCTFTNARDRGTLTLIKNVVNDNGGTALASAFNMHVKQNGVDVAGSPAAGSAAGSVYSLTTGTYTVNEDTPPAGYQQTSVVCDGQPTSTVSVTTNSQKVCTITNNDIAPQLTVIKHVINDNSGNTLAPGFTMNVTGTNVSDASFNGAESPGTTVTLNAGNYSVDENANADYVKTIGANCSGTIALGETKTCTITNDDVAHPALVLTKSGPAVAHEGDNVVYTFSVENTGDEPLDNVVIDDPLIDNINYVSGDTDNDGILDVDETWQFTANYTIPGNQIANVINTATVCADPRLGTEVCDDDDHTIDVLHPSITIVKDGPALAYEGQIVGYTFVVTNTGDTTLFNVTLIDDIATNESCPKTTLTAGESMNCTAIYLIPVPTADNVINNVDACGTDVLQLQVCDDDSHTLDVIHPSINVIKTGPATAHEGDQITYTFTVTNTGDTPLSSNTVNDNVAGGAVYQSGDTNNDTKLDTSETWIFTKQYTIPTPQVANVVNTATACGLDPIQAAAEGGQPVCDTDTHTLDVLHPGINVVKTGPATAHEGDQVTYTFTVTNTGDTALSILTVNDNVAGAGVYQSGDTDADNKLDTTETWIYTKQYTIPTPQAANVVNTVTACGSDSLQLQVCDTDTHTLDVLHPGINVVKTGPATAHEGDQITYTFTVTNTGDTTLIGTAVNDNVAGGAVYQSGDTDNDGNLDTTETWIFTKQYTIPTPQVADVVNTATVCADDSLGQETCDTDTHTLDVLHPGINVVKSGPSTAHEGDNIGYTFTVTNTGDIALSGVTVSDNVAGSATYASGDADNDGQLDLAETWIFTANYVILAEDADPLVNTATACGDDPLQREVCDTDTHRLDVLHPSLNVVKSGPAEASPGDTVTYAFTVTNTGDIALDGVSVNDNVAGGGATLDSGDTDNDGQLDLAETWVYTLDYEIPADQDEHIDNTVTVCADDPLEEEVCDEDQHHLAVLAKVIVTKYNDYNQNRAHDPDEPILPNWEFNLKGQKECEEVELVQLQRDIIIVDGPCDEYDYDKPQTTDDDGPTFGTTTFAGVRPGIAHELSETLQDDWHLSNIDCGERDGSLDGDTYFFGSEGIAPGETVNCLVGNYRDVVLLIDKDNNKPAPTSVGDTVTYTLTITVPVDSGPSYNTTVTDLPPEGFTYVPGSWTASSNIRGDLTPEVTPEPNYGSPGTWLLQRLLPGEVVTLTYRAVIGNTASPGTYPDLAFALGCETPVGDCEVLSNVSAGESSPFVASRVSIRSPQVLAANTTVLVNTGTADVWRNMIAATLLIGLALGTLVRREKKGGRV